MSRDRGSARNRDTQPPATTQLPSHVEDGIASTSIASGPLGLDDRFPWEVCLPGAPASLLSEGAAASSQSSTLPEQPAGAGRGKFGATRRQASPGRQTRHSKSSPERSSQPSEARPPASSSAMSSVRDRLSPEGVAQLKAAANDPGLALNMLVREIVARIGRYAEVGDKSGIKRSVMDLAEKLDVSSPKDGAVLVLQQLGQPPQASSPLNIVLEEGKQSADTTQAGRTLSVLGPILRENGVFDWKDGMDRGWGRVNERFAQQAQGVVDVVVDARTPGAGGAATPAANPGPIGAWNTSPSDAPSVGSWSVPQDAAAGGGAPAVGQWSVGEAPGAGSDVAQPVGSWKLPDQPGDGGPATVGSWTAPDDADGATPLTTGRWSVPDGAGASESGPVGNWNVPEGPEASARVGQWTVGQQAPGSEGATEVGPIGKWSTGDAGASAPSGAPPGQWITAGSGGGSAGADAATTGPKGTSAGEALERIQDLPVGGGSGLKEIIRSNGNITGIRIVEAVADRPGSPAKLRGILEIGRSILEQRFGQP